MSRKRARELAVQFLFQMEVRKEDHVGLMEDFLEDYPMQEEDMRFFRENIEGTVKNLRDIDILISGKLKNWTLERLPGVDLAVLRNALYEIMYRDDIPIKVSINEAVDLAKKFSDSESGVFVNGILGNLVREHDLQ
ncbi:MAG: transcription antitermination factor NusB [Firmicutes bacterium]|nr:transcription antitermination factor NusB [Bacillota bacterium]MDD3298682.1 transcription antitermination factor NusB [Bacillota bacterium]MDD3850529.1 transcription antitermination factor NusB [Bacillota bacterium]